MKKISELKSHRRVMLEALTALVAKMCGAGYIENASDLKDHQWLLDEIAAIDVQLPRAEEDLRKRMGRAIVAPGQERDHAKPRRGPPLKAFKDGVDERGTLIRAEESAYSFGQFLLATCYDSQPAREWCRSRGIAIKAQAEGVNATGGALVPDEWVQSIISLKETFGVFAANARKVPMTRDTMNVPRRTGGVSAYFVNEGVAPTESAATFDNVALIAKKLMVLTRLSNELSEDALVNVADWVGAEIAYAFASKEDDCGFLGDGTSTYGGIRGLSTLMGSAGIYTATGHATADVITAADLMLLRALLPQYARPGAQFFCSQYFVSACFSRLKAAGGGNKIQDLQNASPYNYLGTPIVISQKLPSTTPTGLLAIYFGDLSKAALFGDRRQVTIRRSDERYFDTDQIGIQGTERLDIVCHDVGDSSNIGPIVALKMG